MDRYPGACRAPICSRFACEHLSMRTSVWFLAISLWIASGYQPLCAKLSANSACPRPPVGSIVEEPEDLRSQNGVLEAELTVSDAADANGATRYCYTDASGRESPNLRANPGDVVILHLKNSLTDLSGGTAAPHTHAKMPTRTANDPCTSGIMSPVSTNLHFHGLTIPPVCHQDDVMKNLGATGRCAIRISFSHSGGRAAGSLLVPPAHPRLRQATTSRGRIRRTDRRGNRARQEGGRQACRSESSSFATRISSIRMRRLPNPSQ